MTFKKTGLTTGGLWLWLLMPWCALAQLNESDTARILARASLTGTMQQGNVEVVVLRGKADVVLAPTRALVVKSQNSSLYQSFYSVQADNDVFSRNYLYINPSRRVYPFAIGYVSTNFRRKIKLRYFGGAGATIHLLTTRKNNVKTSLGVVYETTRFASVTYNEVVYDGSTTISLWRPTAWVGGWHNVAEGRLHLYYEAFYQPSFSAKINYRWQATVGVDVPVWRGLAVNALYTYSHENVVVTKIKQADALLTVGLAYTLRRLFDTR